MGNAKLKKDDTLLVVIDFQEKIIPAMHGSEKAIDAAVKLLKGFGILGLPYIATQQYTKGLGETLQKVREAADGFTYIEKSAFSLLAQPEAASALKEAGRKSLVLIGAEAHVCVLQSAIDLAENGYDVHVAVDGIASREKFSKKTAIKQMLFAGIIVETAESVLFKLLENDSRSDTFKAISKLVK
ncbi:MAG: isochorismatase family protein [Clostridiales Family XIII bacterium]|nr:isochorismatase family protein [Clostridiales Family XIII bacterium]